MALGKLNSEIIHSLSYQNRLSLLWIWASDCGEVWIRVSLLRDRDGRREAEGQESLLDVAVSYSVEGRMHKFQWGLDVELPKWEKSGGVVDRDVYEG